jgi:hypothetical protein
LAWARYHNLADFERYKAKGEKIKIDVIGVYNISSDVPPALAEEVWSHQGVWHLPSQPRCERCIGESRKDPIGYFYEQHEQIQLPFVCRVKATSPKWRS